MKKLNLIMLLIVAFSVTSCWDFNREQDYKDAENTGKSILIQAESEKKAMIEEAKARYESAKLNAQTKIEIAKADAESKLILAKAEAAARLMNAESQAKANQMLDQSITSNILEFNKINRWNGKLPTTTLGNQGAIINLK
jgi:regulator of protease activity HflC (stomatin/prohibitin superfamily)